MLRPASPANEDILPPFFSPCPPRPLATADVFFVVKSRFSALFRTFSPKFSSKNAASTAVLAVIPAPFALQVVAMQDIIDNLMTQKKYAKKLKNPLTFIVKKAKMSSDAYQKHNRKKDEKNH
jgi:hypothetical protein